MLSVAIATAVLRPGPEALLPAGVGGEGGGKKRHGGLGLRASLGSAPSLHLEGRGREGRARIRRRDPHLLVNPQESVSLCWSPATGNLEAKTTYKHLAHDSAGQGLGWAQLGGSLGLSGPPSSVGGQPQVSGVALLLGVSRLSAGAVGTRPRVPPYPADWLPATSRFPGEQVTA